MTNYYRTQSGRAKTEVRTPVGGEGGRLQRHNIIEIFCLTFLIKCLWLLLQEDLKTEIFSFTSDFPRSLSSHECLHEYENTDYISLKIWSCNGGKDVNGSVTTCGLFLACL